MKFLIVFVALFALALAAPAEEVSILKSESDVGPDSYKYIYETSNGISAAEQGVLHKAGTENEAISVQGSYKFVGDDGVTYEVSYIADENGFQPQGAHLPTSDGQSAQAEGQLKNIGSENEAISVQGSYKFVGDDGVTYEVSYIADENGFQPQGAHLPVAPEA
ncbi:hypothetical protein M5D96_006781 [Drosophila gunungcola]|uniref:Uncharacterized protein n=1 Tax=Drosophila gunungcola TaxID=103775 RepID=A0A9P9YQB5_9MUSC|nr:hypothetical protein M5D96_006781 [Drosophila gunungcola]